MTDRIFGEAVLQRDGRTCGLVVGGAARLVDHYAANAQPKERTARFVERVGLEAVRADVLRFAPYLPLEDAS